MRFGSVCSGIEAASVAFAPLGWRAAWLSETAPFPSAVLAHHYPDVPNLGDMTALADMIDAEEIEAPDLLCGGCPCQSFSIAGLRKSLADQRGNLTLEFIRIADAIDRVRRNHGKPPAWVLYENVPGILNTKDNAFGAFLGGLCGGDAALDAPINGWPSAGVVAGPARTVAWRVLDAQYFGVAQRRRRVFVLALAGAGGWRCADALLPVTDSLSRHPAPSRGAREGVAGTLAARTHGGGGLGTDFDLDGGVVPLAFGGNKTSGPIDLSTALRAKGGSGHNDFDSETFVLDDLITFDTTQISSPTNRSNPQPGDPCHTLSKDAHAPLIAFDCKASGRSGFGIGEIAGTQRAMGHANSHSNGGGHQAVAYSTKMHNTKSNNAGKIFEERTTALDANSPAPALLTHMSARRLTPRECERLMGLPDNYTLIPLAQMKPSDAMRFASDGPRYKSIGNSWAVPCVSWIGERIVEVDASRTRGGK